MKKLQFTQELQNDLINGATIVFARQSEEVPVAVIMVRLPKGKWAQVDTANGITEFEYNQYDLNREGKLYCATWRNGTKREVTKKAEEDYYNQTFHAKRKN